MLHDCDPAKKDYMMSKRRNREKKAVRQQPDERLKHGEFEEFDGGDGGDRTVRNMTTDPVDTYFARSAITPTQHTAARIFANHFQRARMAPGPSAVCLNRVYGGIRGDGEQFDVVRSRRFIKAALAAVGCPLGDLIEHCVGRQHTAGSWHGVARAKRPDQAGMIALRLALDGLVDHYRLC